MIRNPIVSAVAREAAAKDLAISGITVLAPLAVGAPLLAIGWAGLIPDGTHEIDAPQNISVMAMARAPDSVVPLPPMVDTEGQVISAAWAHGAWDITRTSIGAGYSGPMPPYAASIAGDLRDQGYVSWYWRPMLRGPEIRDRQKRPDLTLDRWTRGRDGPPPEISRPPLVAGRQVTIKLGDDGRRHRARQAEALYQPATDRQRAYLTRLLRDAGEDACLPERLDRRAASAWIDRLTGTVPEQPSQAPRKRKVLIGINQWRVIDHHLRRLGRPALPPGTMMRMTWDEAAAMIDQLRGET